MPFKSSEAERLYQAEYRRKNRERIAAQKAERYQATREAHLEKDRARYQAKKDSPDYKAKAAARQRAYRRRVGMKAVNVRNRYGLSLEEYESLLASQGGVCATCGGTTRLVVDHDHATGAVRGILCHGCNVSLGMARDDARVLRSLADYVERSERKVAA